MRCVFDASLFVKVLLGDPAREPHTAEAERWMRRFVDAEVSLVQPPHWLAEVAAVMTRLSPDSVDRDLARLFALELSVLDGVEVYLTAAKLAGSLDHHLFDTLYHAVALEADATLITADRRYASKAASIGRVQALGG